MQGSQLVQSHWAEWDGPLKTQSVNKTLPESSMNDDEAPLAN